MNNPKLVLLETFASREEAISVQAVLKGEGIFSQIDENFSSNAFPNLQILNGVKLYVTEDHLDHAVSVLENVQPFIENPDESDFPEENLPEGFEPLEELTANEEDKIEQAKPKGCLSGCFGSIVLIGIGFVLGVLLTFSLAMSLGDRPDRYDRNSDGLDDEIYLYNNLGEAIKGLRDNNFDGEMDEWTDYDDGLLSNIKLDTDFNRVANTWMTFKNGIIDSVIFDSNEDGIPEIYTHFEHGILKRKEWKTPDGKVVRREIYKKEVLSEIYKIDANGQLKLSEKLDFQGLQLPLE